MGKGLLQLGGRWLLQASAGAAGWLPEAVQRGLAVCMGRLAARLPLKHNRVMRRNLQLAFGEALMAAQRERLAEQTLIEWSKTAWETLAAARQGPAPFLARIQVVGRDHLDAALSDGRGVVALTAHFGNFFLLGAKLAAEGYDFEFLIREPNDEAVAALLRDLRSRLGLAWFPARPRNVAVRRSLECLRRNGILGLVNDQNAARGSVFVDFFGRPAATTTGPVVLALRSGASIVPMFMVRQPDDTHRLIIERPLRLERTGHQDQDIATYTAQLTRLLEGWIRRHPSHWLWIHDRWRRPPEAQRLK